MEYGWKGKKYNLPTTLREVTLRQKIEFDSIYREEIMRLQDEVFKTDENGDDLPVDEIDIQMLNINVAVMNISFFTGIPIEEINREMCIEDIMTLYYSCFDQMYSDQEIEFDRAHMFKDEFWHIAAPELTHESGLTFNEFIISKQIVKQIQELGGGKWDVLPALAAVYLRKEDEPFNESFIAPGSERIELMYDLTLDIALQVAFFLESSMSSYLKTSAFLEQDPAAEDQT